MGEIMEIKIEARKKNPLIKREEISVRVMHPDLATPSRLELVKELRKLLGIDENLIIVDKIFTEKGQARSNVKVYAYEKESDIPKDKLEKMKRRMKVKKEGENGKEEQGREEEGKENKEG